MHVMVEQIPKIGDDSVGAGGVVIRSEARRERLVPIERASNPPERILVNLDVGVDEHDYVSPRPAARRGFVRPQGRGVGENRRRSAPRSGRCALDRRDGHVQRPWPVSGRNHNAERCHLLKSRTTNAHSIVGKWQRLPRQEPRDEQ
jgi:hypothetical protein